MACGSLQQLFPLTLGVLMWWNHCHGYPTGAPQSVCNSLQPGISAHGTAQNDASPYTLTASSSSVAAGQRVTVTVSGSNGLNLRGIFLQARVSGDPTALGSFTSFDSGNYKTVDCSSTTASGVTHSSRTDKAVPQTFTWTAPDGLNEDVQFIATVVQTTNTYWTNIMSSSVTIRESDQSTTLDANGGSQNSTASPGDGSTASPDDGSTTSPDDGGNTGDRSTTSSSSKHVLSLQMTTVILMMFFFVAL